MGSKFSKHTRSYYISKINSRKIPTDDFQKGLTENDHFTKISQNTPQKKRE